MDKIAKTTAEAIQNNEPSISRANYVIREILDVTRDVTGPQAVAIIGATATITIGTCYAINKIVYLVKSNHIKDIDFMNKKITFYDPSSLPPRLRENCKPSYGGQKRSKRPPQR